MEKRDIIKHIEIKGFKSIKDVELDLNPLNILIGPNGVGKSNFIGLFKFLNQLVNKNLQQYIRLSGGAERFLFLGGKVTKNIEIKIDFEFNKYKLNLIPAVPNTLNIKDEIGFFDADKAGYSGGPKTRHYESKDGLETGLPSPGRLGIGSHIARHLNLFKIYHFHDTSNSAEVKMDCKKSDNSMLRSKAENLAAMLYQFKNIEAYSSNYEKIVDAIRLVAPFFNDFILEPDQAGFILPKWTQIGTDKTFDFYDLSDGTLRFLCLATLLLQPLDFIPPIILIDEPELGLHPYAIKILAELMKSVSKQGKQVIASSQSITLINEFSADDILIADRKDNETIIKKLHNEEIKEWLDCYRIGEIWEKNIIGGNPDD